MLKMAWYSKTYTLLTSVHNDLDSADDAEDYNRVTGISKREQKIAKTHPTKCTHPPINPPIHTKTSELGNYNKLSQRLSLKMEKTL